MYVIIYTVVIVMRDTTLFEKHSAVFDSDIGLYYSGKRIKTKNHVYGPEIRMHFLFVLVEDGRAVLRSHGNLCINTHDMLVMFPGERIHYEALTDWSIRWIGAASDELETSLGKIGVTRRNPIMSPKNFPVLAELASSIYEISDKTDLAGRYKCRALLNEFFANLFMSTDGENFIDPVKYAVGLMDYNYDREVSVEQIAAAVNTDSAYFSRLFKKTLGVSPKRYILNKRIAKARELLCIRSLSIKEIAVSVGYADPLYFCRIFKKSEGVSPSEYRARRTNDSESTGADV